jgi:hypothetical protein
MTKPPPITERTSAGLQSSSPEPNGARLLPAPRESGTETY